MSRCGLIHRAIPGLVAFVLVAACSAGTSTTAAVSSPPASSVATTTPTAAGPSPSDSTAPISSPGASPAVHIPLPAHWQQVDLTEAALIAQVQALKDSNPELAKSIEGLLASEQFRNMIFFAIGYRDAAQIGNVNVMAVPLGGLPLEAQIPAIEGQFKELGATDVKVSHSTLLGQPAIVIDYRLNVQTPSGSPAAMSGRAHFIPVGESAYGVTVTCVEADPSACLADADTMVRGMTVGP